MSLSKAMWLVFVATASVVIFLLPPMTPPDEIHHWKTSEALELSFVEENQSCTYGLSFSEFFEPNRINLNSNERVKSGTFSAADTNLKPSCSQARSLTLGALVYPAQSLVKLFGSAANQPIQAVEYFYLSRMLNLAFVAFVLWRLIQVSGKKTRIGVFFLMGLFLTPIGVQQSSVVSTDPMILVFCLMMIFLTVYEKKANFLDYCLFAIAGASTLYPKPIFLLAYLPLIAKYLLEFKELRTIGDWKSTWKLSIIPSIATLHGIIAVGGAVFFSSLVENAVKPGVDPAYIKSYLFEPPFSGIGVLFHSLSLFLDPKVYLGPLGSLDTKLIHSTEKSYFILCYTLLLGALLTLPNWRWKKNRVRILNSKSLIALSFLVAGFGLACLSALGMYLYWTSPEFAKIGIDGLQARYFIPPLVLMSGSIFVMSNIAPDAQEDETNMDKYFRRFEPIGILLTFVFGSKLLTGIAVSLLRRYW